jgi:hypothetical protein
MKHMQKLVHTGTLLAAFAAICLLAGTAKAQTYKLTLPFEVRWGQGVLAAGEYELRLSASGHWLATIQEIHGKAAVVVMPIVADDHNLPTRDALLVVRHGNESRVCELRLASLGRVLIYEFEPRTARRSKKAEQARAAQEIPVHSSA